MRRVLIAGTGRVGLQTVRAVRDSGHEVVVVEADREAATRARGEGVAEDDAALASTLARADLDRVEVVVALTRDRNANLAVCPITDEHDCRTVAEVKQNPQTVEFTTTPEAPMNGDTLCELELPGRARLIALVPGGERLSLPTPDNTLSSGDWLVVLVDSGRPGDVRRSVAGESAPVQGDA